MLHGAILVNEKCIGTWVAVRKQHPPQEVNDYECAIEYQDQSGVRHDASFTIKHVFTEGALILTARIMFEAARQIHPTPEDPEDAKDRPPRLPVS